MNLFDNFFLFFDERGVVGVLAIPAKFARGTLSGGVERQTWPLAFVIFIHRAVLLVRLHAPHPYGFRAFAFSFALFLFSF